MNRLVAFALVLSLASPAWPQTVTAPPPPPDPESPPPPPPSEVSYYDSCFGVPRPGTGRFGIGGEVIVPLSGSSSGGGPPGISLPSGSGDDRAALLVAVLAVAALPVVLYTVDNPAPRLVLQRFECPTFSLDLMGGAEASRSAANGGSGFVSTRFSFGIGHVATDFQFDGASNSGVSAFAAHMLFRVTPHEHVDGGLAIGYRRSVLDDRIQDGLEIGLPHRYALWRDGLKTFALELRPMLLLGSSVEPSLEAAFLIPVAQIFHLRLGGRVYTFQGDLMWGLAGGINLTL
jgi:hypothetical protein